MVASSVKKRTGLHVVNTYLAIMYGDQDLLLQLHGGGLQAYSWRHQLACLTVRRHNLSEEFELEHFK